CEDLEVLLTAARPASTVAPDSNVTVETLRAQIAQLQSPNAPAGTQGPRPGGNRAGANPAPLAPTPPQAVAPSPPVVAPPAPNVPPAVVPPAPNVPPVGVPGAPPSAELRARLAANSAALALWNRLTARSGA